MGEATAFSLTGRGLSSVRATSPEERAALWNKVSIYNEVASMGTTFALMRLGHFALGKTMPVLTQSRVWGRSNVNLDPVVFNSPLGRHFTTSVPSAYQLNKWGQLLYLSGNTAVGVGGMWLGHPLSNPLLIGEGHAFDASWGGLVDASAGYLHAVAGFRLTNRISGGKLQAKLAKTRHELGLTDLKLDDSAALFKNALDPQQYGRSQQSLTEALRVYRALSAQGAMGVEGMQGVHDLGETYRLNLLDASKSPEQLAADILERSELHSAYRRTNSPGEPAQVGDGVNQVETAREADLGRNGKVESVGEGREGEVEGEVEELGTGEIRLVEADAPGARPAADSSAATRPHYRVIEEVDPGVEQLLQELGGSNFPPISVRPSESGSMRTRDLGLVINWATLTLLDAGGQESAMHVAGSGDVPIVLIGTKVEPKMQDAQGMPVVVTSESRGFATFAPDGAGDALAPVHAALYMSSGGTATNQAKVFLVAARQPKTAGGDASPYKVKVDGRELADGEVVQFSGGEELVLVGPRGEFPLEINLHPSLRGGSLAHERTVAEPIQASPVRSTPEVKSVDISRLMVSLGRKIPLAPHSPQSPWIRLGEKDISSSQPFVVIGSQSPVPAAPGQGFATFVPPHSQEAGLAPQHVALYRGQPEGGEPGLYLAVLDVRGVLVNGQLVNKGKLRRLRGDETIELVGNNGKKVSLPPANLLKTGPLDAAALEEQVGTGDFTRVTREFAQQTLGNTAVTPAPDAGVRPPAEGVGLPEPPFDTTRLVSLEALRLSHDLQAGAESSGMRSRLESVLPEGLLEADRCQSLLEESGFLGGVTSEQRPMVVEALGEWIRNLNDAGRSRNFVVQASPDALSFTSFVARETSFIDPTALEAGAREAVEFKARDFAELQQVVTELLAADFPGKIALTLTARSISQSNPTLIVYFEPKHRELMGAMLAFHEPDSFAEGESTASVKPVSGEVQKTSPQPGDGAREDRFDLDDGFIDLNEVDSVGSLGDGATPVALASLADPQALEGFLTGVSQQRGGSPVFPQVKAAIQKWVGNEARQALLAKRGHTVTSDGQKLTIQSSGFVPEAKLQPWTIKAKSAAQWESIIHDLLGGVQIPVKLELPLTFNPNEGASVTLFFTEAEFIRAGRLVNRVLESQTSGVSVIKPVAVDSL